MKTIYRAFNPQGGYIDNLNKQNLPQDWEIIEVQVEDNIDGSVELKKSKIEEIDNYYTALISELVSKHVEKSIIDGIPIPQNVLDQRNALRLECNQKIQEIDPSQTMAKLSQTKTNEIISTK